MDAVTDAVGCWLHLIQLPCWLGDTDIVARESRKITVPPKWHEGEKKDDLQTNTEYSFARSWVWLARSWLWFAWSWLWFGLKGTGWWSEWWMCPGDGGNKCCLFATELICVIHLIDLLLNGCVKKSQPTMLYRGEEGVYNSSHWLSAFHHHGQCR